MALRAMVATRLLTASLESTEGLGVRQAVGSFTRIEVRIREAQESDEPRILEIGNAIYPEYRETLKELRHDLARLRDGGYISVLSVAEEPGGQIIGHSHYHQIPWQFDPARFRVDVYVDPAWRRRAAGAALYDHMLEAVVARGGRHLESSVRDTPVPFEQFLQVNVESPRALLAYRGRGIAMVLKLATIEFARAHGHSKIRTWNEVNNVEMLAINDRLGFVRQPAWLTFEREVGAAPEATVPRGPNGDA